MRLEAAITPLVVYNRKGRTSSAPVTDLLSALPIEMLEGTDLLQIFACASSLLPDFASESFVDASDAFPHKNSLEVCSEMLRPEMDLFCVSVSSGGTLLSADATPFTPAASPVAVAMADGDASHLADFKRGCRRRPVGVLPTPPPRAQAAQEKGTGGASPSAQLACGKQEGAGLFHQKATTPSHFEAWARLRGRTNFRMHFRLIPNCLSRRCRKSILLPFCHSSDGNQVSSLSWRRRWWRLVQLNCCPVAVVGWAESCRRLIRGS